tara:strand:+ start:252 stop:533 length:282 start_codon:yes stop_codon:yes gene_type:complete
VKDIIRNIEVKLEKFISKHKNLSDKILILEQENNDLTDKLRSKEEDVLTLEGKIKLMNISKSVDVSEEEVKATRLKINEYVREIDKCIALLNK